MVRRRTPCCSAHLSAERTDFSVDVRALRCDSVGATPTAGSCVDTSHSVVGRDGFTRSHRWIVSATAMFVLPGRLSGAVRGWLV